MDLTRPAKYLTQNHPKGDLWFPEEGRPAFPDEWDEWKKWSGSEKILYFLALNLWNGFTDLEECPLDPARILLKLDADQLDLVRKAFEEDSAHAMA